VHLAWVGFEFTTLVVIVIDCLGSYKFNNLPLTAQTVTCISVLGVSNFPLFLRCLDWILKLFPQCGILVCLFLFVFVFFYHFITHLKRWSAIKSQNLTVLLFFFLFHSVNAYIALVYIIWDYLLHNYVSISLFYTYNVTKSML
jgi:hypothetical protein